MKFELHLGRKPLTKEWHDFSVFRHRWTRGYTFYFYVGYLVFGINNKWDNP